MKQHHMRISRRGLLRSAVAVLAVAALTATGAPHTHAQAPTRYPDSALNYPSFKIEQLNKIRSTFADEDGNFIIKWLPKEQVEQLEPDGDTFSSPIYKISGRPGSALALNHVLVGLANGPTKFGAAGYVPYQRFSDGRWIFSGEDTWPFTIRYYPTPSGTVEFAWGVGTQFATPDQDGAEVLPETREYPGGLVGPSDDTHQRWYFAPQIRYATRRAATWPALILVDARWTGRIFVSSSFASRPIIIAATNYNSYQYIAMNSRWKLPRSEWYPVNDTFLGTSITDSFPILTLRMETSQEERIWNSFKDAEAFGRGFLWGDSDLSDSAKLRDNLRVYLEYEVIGESVTDDFIWGPAPFYGTPIP
jgi:hypothetical protein